MIPLWDSAADSLMAILISRSSSSSNVKPLGKVRIASTRSSVEGWPTKQTPSVGKQVDAPSVGMPSVGKEFDAISREASMEVDAIGMGRTSARSAENQFRRRTVANQEYTRGAQESSSFRQKRRGETRNNVMVLWHQADKAQDEEGL